VVVDAGVLVGIRFDHAGCHILGMWSSGAPTGINGSWRRLVSNSVMSLVMWVATQCGGGKAGGLAFLGSMVRLIRRDVGSFAAASCRLNTVWAASELTR